jgi:hypothetical protein
MSINRQKNQMDAKNQINALTRSALALALSVLSLLIFRGTTSIFSAFIIPVVIALFSKRNEVLSFVYIATSLIMMTVLFFQTQIIFIIGYLLLSLVLKCFLMDAAMKVKFSFTGILKYLLAVMAILFMGIWLTQVIFLIPIHDMMLRFSNNHPLRYLGILLVEGIAITLVNLLFLKAMTSRIKF